MKTCFPAVAGVAPLEGRWRRIARGSQHDIWADPERGSVLRVERSTPASWFSRVLCPLGQRQLVQQRLGDLALPGRLVSQPRWRDEAGTIHKARRGSLLPWLAPEQFLAAPLWRQPDPERAASGVEALGKLLENLARRDLLILDFVSDNFGWHERRLCVVDADLVVPRAALRHLPVRLTAAGFGLCLGRDYRRLLERRATEARLAGDLDLACRLTTLAERFPALVRSLARRRLPLAAAGTSEEGRPEAA